MESARRGGICAEGYGKMRGYDRDGLIGYYLENPDWCLERNFPTLSELREHFSDIEHKGVYIDKTFHGELLNDLQVYVFHNCKGEIKVGLNAEKAIIPMFYIANGCKLKVVGVGNIKPLRPSIVPVYVFGKNSLKANNNIYVEFRRYDNKLL